MTPSEVAKILTQIKEAYPHVALTKEKLELWSSTLADIDYGIARRVIYDWIMDEEWPPTIAELRKRTQDASGVLTADAAWAMVQERIKNTYPGHPAEEWDAPQAVKDALKAIPGGMRTIRMSDKPENMRQQFVRAYKDKSQDKPDVKSLDEGWRMLT